MLRERFRITHTTVQFEAAECEIVHGCVIQMVSESRNTITSRNRTRTDCCRYRPVDILVVRLRTVCIGTGQRRRVAERAM